MDISKLLPVSDEVYRERLDVCNACPFANHFGLVIQCDKCKCEMHIKGHLARKKEGCPEGKWER